jgi:hypothetical protein
MAKKFPQYTKRISGSNPAWYKEQSGTLLRDLYFDTATPPSATGQIKVWLTAWTAKPLKWWNGTSWVAKPVKYNNGTSWVTTGY